MYDTERLKHLIGEASFDGWIENGGPNGDQDGKCQLLREEDALNVIIEAKNDLLEDAIFTKRFNFSEDINHPKSEVEAIIIKIEKWQKWFGDLK